MTELNCGEMGWVKLDLLSRGIEIDNSIAQFMKTTSPVALRKNFYNTPLWVDQALSVPQELRLSGVVVGLNSYGPSIWRLKWPGEGTALILENKMTGQQYQPELIEDLHLFSEIKEAGHIANLYGGTALAFFSPRTCYLFADGTECRFCSLAGTAKETKNYKAILADREIEETVRAALALDKERIEQIMIVGGNMRDLDAGFRHHVSLAKAASTVLERANLSKTVSVHIATMPPFDLDLIKMLADFENVHVMFNLEVWDQAAFSVICPGKEHDYGRKKTLKALEVLRDIIGEYRAHSLLVTGLESSETTMAGARTLAEMGISPIINIYHSDRYSRLGLTVRPTFNRLAEIARKLQELYLKFPMKAYWRNCGRNSIDAEAERGLFKSPIPDFLTEEASDNV